MTWQRLQEADVEQLGTLHVRLGACVCSVVLLVEFLQQEAACNEDLLLFLDGQRIRHAFRSGGQASQSG